MDLYKVRKEQKICCKIINFYGNDPENYLWGPPQDQMV